MNHLFYECCASGNVDVIKFLIQTYNIDPSFQGNVCIRTATFHNHKNIIQRTIFAKPNNDSLKRLFTKLIYKTVVFYFCEYCSFVARQKSGSK